MLTLTWTAKPIFFKCKSNLYTSEQLRASKRGTVFRRNWRTSPVYRGFKFCCFLSSCSGALPEQEHKCSICGSNARQKSPGTHHSPDASDYSLHRHLNSCNIYQMMYLTPWTHVHTLIQTDVVCWTGSWVSNELLVVFGCKETNTNLIHLKKNNLSLGSLSRNFCR